MNEETATTTTNPETNPERVPRPEEVIEELEERPEDVSPRPLRCRFGSRTQDGGCPRDATGWLHPESREVPVCDEHARVAELAGEVQHWELALGVTEDWLRLAKAWGHEDLERMATNGHEEANEEMLKAEARVELAREIADAPRKGRERPEFLTFRQEEKLLGLIARSDALVHARTALQDHATGKIDEEVLRPTLGVLIEEGEKAAEETHRYKEELGIQP